MTPRILTDSPAFRAAVLRSEVSRAYAVIGVVVLAVLLVLVRASYQELERPIIVAAVGGVLVLIAMQLIALLYVKWVRRNDRLLPNWFVILSVVIESLVPSGIIACNLIPGGMPPFATLSAPPIVMYGLIITLTTLRLRPTLCVLAGLLSSVSYLGLLAYVVYGMKIASPTTGLPPPAYGSYAALIFLSGLAGAWVAREIRSHMEAALREAETRRQVERMEQDLSVARTIQRSLLPRSAPTIAGYDIAGWNRPADQTGGDYYDWQKLPDGNWMVTLADVSGHGIGPALVTAACRAYVRASGAQHIDLSSLTARINRLLADDLPSGRFVTMVSVLIDASGGPLALLSAGHGPIVLYVGQTGAVEDIMPQDMPLAIVADMTFGPAHPIEMKPGDVLALVTDGFTEWARPSTDGQREQFGMDRLRDSLRRHANLTASAMIEAITRDVSAFAGVTPQQDDLTMVIIRRV